MLAAAALGRLSGLEWNLTHRLVQELQLDILIPAASCSSCANSAHGDARDELRRTAWHKHCNNGIPREYGTSRHVERDCAPREAERNGLHCTPRDIAR